MGRFFKIMVLCCFSLMLSGCGSEEDDDVLVLGTSADSPPYEFWDTSTRKGEIKGFDIDVARAIADKMGKTLEIVDTEFSSLIPALKVGKLDFAMAYISATPERRKAVDFSVPYWREHTVFLSRYPVESLEDLKSRKYGVQLGSSQEAIAASLKKSHGLRYVTRDKVIALVQELIVGRLDAVMVSEVVAKAYLQRNPDLYLWRSPVGTADYVAIIQKGDTVQNKINHSITQLQQEGVIAKIAAKWLRIEVTE